jgi:hypothetical protein
MYQGTNIRQNRHSIYRDKAPAKTDAKQRRVVIGDEQSPFTEEQYRRLARQRTHSKCIAPQFKI